MSRKRKKSPMQSLGSAMSPNKSNRRKRSIFDRAFSTRKKDQRRGLGTGALSTFDKSLNIRRSRRGSGLGEALQRWINRRAPLERDVPFEEIERDSELDHYYQGERVTNQESFLRRLIYRIRERNKFG